MPLTCDNIQSPFVLGFFRPRIYIPSGMEEQQLQYVLDHEKAHIRRRDHWWKPLSFLLLTVYWFHPLLWVAYILLCRDIEQACDEKVISRLDAAGKRGYLDALVACSTHRRMILVCPVAFGEVSLKTRVREIVQYKKPAFWVVLVAVLVCIAAAVCFLTDPIPCGHSWQGQITTPSTCTQSGIRTLTCELCKEQKAESVPTAAHNYGEAVVIKAPSCQERGTRQYTCHSCGHQKTESISHTSHIAGAPSFVTEPNCTDTGKRSATCTLCQTVYMVELLETNQVHDMHETVVRAATCAEPGEGVLTCSRCGCTEACTYPQLEHSYRDGEVILSTCGWEGSKQRICTGCGDTYYITLPKTDDHYWCDGGFYWPDWCSFCGKTKPNSYRSTSSNDYEEQFSPQPVWKPSDGLPTVPPIEPEIPRPSPGGR